MSLNTTGSDLLDLSRSLKVEENPESEFLIDSDASRLLIKLKSLLKSRDPLNFNSNADSLEILIDSAGLHYRRSTISVEINSTQPPIVFLPEGGAFPSILYSSRGKKYVYSPVSDLSLPLTDTTQLPLDGYEIYAGLPTDIQSIWSLYHFIAPVMVGDSVIAIILALLLTGVSLVTPWLTSQVVGNVVPSGSLPLLLNAFIVGLLITLFASAFTWLQSIYLSRIQHAVSQRLQVAVYDRVMRLPLEFIHQYSTGDFASRINGLQQVARSLSGSPLAALISSLSLIGYALLMFYYDATLAIWSVGLVLSGGVVQFILARRQIKLQRGIELSEADVYQSSLQIISALPQIRSNGSELLAIRRWFNGLIHATSKQYTKSSTESLSELVSEVVSTAGKAVLFAVVVYRMIAAEDLAESVTAATTFIIFSATYDSMANKFIEVIAVVNDLIGSTYLLWERAFPILSHSAEPGYSIISPVYKSDFSDCLNLKSVTFTYPGSQIPVFEDLNCSFKHGKFNAVFGPSGCGKSTLFNLILQFYCPSSGSITIDGIPVVDIFLKDYRRLFGVILQRPTLPAGSIRDAVSSGLDYSDTQIWEALEFANAASEVGEMPMKLETMLSEGALNISGGQRQRLAIARAIIRKPLILLEDEATSALDAASQATISKNLLSAGITRIVVAHRLSAISSCDHIIVLNAGRIEAEGEYRAVVRSSPYLSSVVKGSSF